MDKFNWRKVRRSCCFRKKVQKIYLELKTVPRNVSRIVENSEKSGKLAEIVPSENVSATSNHFNGNIEESLSVNNTTELQNHDYINADDKDTVDDKNQLIDNDFVKDEIFRTNLRNWEITFNISHHSLKVLSEICNKRKPNSLPKDPRTLLQTPVITTIQPLGLTGQYWHQGLSFCLLNCFAVINESLKISININIDGLPIYPNSSREEFWPILFNIYEKPNIQPMVIGIYFGKGKPFSLDSFLRPFVDEAKEVLTNGIIINNQHISSQLQFDHLCVTLRH